MTDPSDLSGLLNRPLARGLHGRPEDGACVIEWLRLHERAEFSDKRLPCQSPVLHRFLIAVNDRAPDDVRERLKPLALRSLGTANDRQDRKRAYRLADVACREWAPLTFEARGFRDWAEKLRALPPVRTKATAVRAQKECRAAAAVAAAAATYAIYAADAATADAAAYAAIATAAAGRIAAAAATAASAGGGDFVWTRALEVLEEIT